MKSDERTNKGWTCRRCTNGDHKACEGVVRGLSCVCTHEGTYVRVKADRCQTCDYVLTELKGARYCINHSCQEFKVVLTEVATDA